MQFLPPYLDEQPSAAQVLASADVLYSDLDGTLIARGGTVLADAAGTPSTVVADAIVAVNAAGLRVVPVSGRDRHQLFELARLLGWQSYIAEAGGVIVHGIGPDARVSYNNGDWPASAIEPGDTPFEIISRSGAVEALAAAFPGRSEFFSAEDMHRETSVILRGCLDRDAAQKVLDAIDPPVEILDNGVVRTTPSLACFETPAHAYHIVPRGVSKAQAITLDLKLRELDASRAIAIGDSAADLQMAESVGLLALVDNAFESRAVLEDLERLGPANVVRLRGTRGEGWAELAHAWLTARNG